MELKSLINEPRSTDILLMEAVWTAEKYKSFLTCYIDNQRVNYFGSLVDTLVKSDMPQMRSKGEFTNPQILAAAYQARMCLLRDDAVIAHDPEVEATHQRYKPIAKRNIPTIINEDGWADKAKSLILSICNEVITMLPHDVGAAGFDSLFFSGLTISPGHDAEVSPQLRASKSYRQYMKLGSDLCKQNTVLDVCRNKGGNYSFSKEIDELHGMDFYEISRDMWSQATETVINNPPEPSKFSDLVDHASFCVMALKQDKSWIAKKNIPDEKIAEVAYRQLKLINSTLKMGGSNVEPDPLRQEVIEMALKHGLSALREQFPQICGARIADSKRQVG